MNNIKAVLVQWADGNMVLRKMNGTYEKGMDVEKFMDDQGFAIVNMDDVKCIKFMDDFEYGEWSHLFASNPMGCVASLV